MQISTKKIIIPCILVLFILIPVSYAISQNRTGVQGILIFNNGTRVNDNVPFIFNILDNSGSTIWTESQSVNVIEGRFSAVLGLTTPLNATVFENAENWSITIDSDAPLTNPLLMKTPYAVVADKVLSGIEWVRNSSYLYPVDNSLELRLLNNINMTGNFTAIDSGGDILINIIEDGLYVGGDGTNPDFAHWLGDRGSAYFNNNQNPAADIYLSTAKHFGTIFVEGSTGLVSMNTFETNPSFILTVNGSINASNLNVTGDVCLSDGTCLSSGAGISDGSINSTSWNNTDNGIITADLSKNVGIGTTTPNHILVVNDTAPILHVVGTIGASEIRLENDANKWRFLNGATGAFQFRDETAGTSPFLINQNAPTLSFYILHSGIEFNSIGLPYNHTVKSDNDAKAIFLNGVTDTLTLQSGGGLTGIGTLAPQSLLDVTGSDTKINQLTLGSTDIIDYTFNLSWLADTDNLNREMARISGGYEVTAQNGFIELSTRTDGILTSVLRLDSDNYANFTGNLTVDKQLSIGCDPDGNSAATMCGTGSVGFRLIDTANNAETDFVSQGGIAQWNDISNSVSRPLISAYGDNWGAAGGILLNRFSNKIHTYIYGDNGLMSHWDGTNTILNHTVTVNFKDTVSFNTSINQENGNATIIIPYAEIYFHNDTADGYLEPMNVAGQFQNISGFSNQTSESGSKLNGFTFSENTLTADISGLYKIDYAISFGRAGGVAREFIGGVMINGVYQENTEIHRIIGSGGDVGNAGSTGFIQLNAGDTINLVMANEGGTEDAEIHAVNFNLIRIG